MLNDSVCCRIETVTFDRPTWLSQQRPELLCLMRRAALQPPMRLLALLCTAAACLPSALCQGSNGTAASSALPEVVSVSTPQQLAAAVNGGAAHVVITQHLNLTGLPALPDGSANDAVLATNATSRSIQVRDIPSTSLCTAVQDANVLQRCINVAL